MSRFFLKGFIVYGAIRGWMVGDLRCRSSRTYEFSVGLLKKKCLAVSG